MLHVLDVMMSYFTAIATNSHEILAKCVSGINEHLLNNNHTCIMMINALEHTHSLYIKKN